MIIVLCEQLLSPEYKLSALPRKKYEINMLILNLIYKFYSKA